MKHILKSLTAQRINEKRCESKMSEIKIVRTAAPKEKPQDEAKLGFGAVTTDHMFIMDYTE